MKICLNHVWFNISAALVLSGITSVAVAANEKGNPPPRAYEDRVYVNDERLPNYGDTRPRTYGSYSMKNGNSGGGRSSPAKEKSSSDANTAPNDCEGKSPSTSNPVIIATGEKFKTEHDIVAECK